MAYSGFYEFHLMHGLLGCYFLWGYTKEPASAIVLPYHKYVLHSVHIFSWHFSHFHILHAYMRETRSEYTRTYTNGMQSMCDMVKRYGNSFK
jgi:hypothetical protein